MRIPKAIQRLTEAFERLPGIGPKTAQRLTFYLLHTPQNLLDEFAFAVGNLKKNTKQCSLCHLIDEVDPCSICSNPSRDQTKICVVEESLDLLYHVLGGVINPLNNIGPEELNIFDLLIRLKSGKIKEVILAANPTMEGEATALFITQMIRKDPTTCQMLENKHLVITRIGRGLPTGADLQYADELTLRKALEGRREY